MTFVEGQILTAIQLNAAVSAIITNANNFAATAIYAGNTSGATFLSVLGSASSPDTSHNATAIFQKITTGQTSGSLQNPTVYISSAKTGTGVGYRITPLLVEATDAIGGNGSFIEGARFHGTLGAGSSSGQANGLVTLAQSVSGAPFNFMIGIESVIENSTADAPAIFNPNNFAVDYLATNAQAGTSKVIDAYYMCNPFNAKPARIGFFNPPGASVSDAAVRSYGTTVYGIDLSKATISYAALAIPNFCAIMARNAANTADMNIAYVDTSNRLILGNGTAGTQISAPVANGTVATVLGSLGPVGSHTTVQEWIPVVGTGGVTRYIPSF